MTIAQNVFNSLSHMWADHRLPMNMKLRLYRSAVCSSFTHACEAWKFTDPVRKMINGFNSRCLTHITGKDYEVTATQPDFDLISTIVKRRLRFAGHIIRMNPDRLLRRSFLAYVKSSHPLPVGSLLHNCDEMTIDQICRLAQNRRAWARFINSMNS